MDKNQMVSLLICIQILLSNPILAAETVLTYNTYNLEYATLPFWSNTIMYNESIMFVGKDDTPTLLFPPTSIISITSYDGQKKYTEGVDFTVKNDKIYLTSNTKIPYFTKEEYYPSSVTSPNSAFVSTNKNYKYIRFSEGSFFQQRQVLVTYYHTKNNVASKIQETYGQKFPNLLSKLKKKAIPKILFYGDSITVGANASGYLKQAPNTPIWPVMVQQYLEKKFSTKINYINTAIGGKESTWGLQYINENVLAFNPDFVVIAFGMNDGLNKNAFKENIVNMINSIMKINKNCEILLVSTTLPNKEALNFTQQQHAYEEVLCELAELYSNVGLARMTSMHLYLMNKKRFYDMTGNNVNHPNDFLERVYAQTVLRAMLTDY